METLEVIRRTLATSLNLDESEKSSHWKFYTKQYVIDDYHRIKGISGFSSRSKAFPFSGAIHERAQKRIFPNFEEAKKSRFYALAKHICKLQERAVHVCVIRHVFTFMLLEEFSLLKKNLTCCVIGDGQSNFISIASAGKFFDKLIYINLGEVLLSDLDLLEKLPLQPRNVRLAQGESELKILLKDKHVKIILVRAHDKNLLEDMNIDLFINMASFQEMTNQLVSQYFQVIKSNKATLYCCNREVKVLRGGERLEFDQYPWGDAEILVDESCPWHKYFYDFRSPRLFRRLSYDGSLRHRLARFK